MIDPMTAIPAAGLGGIFTWLGQVGMAYFRSRDDRQAKRIDTDASLEQHRDKLTFELLRAAREEVAAARVEASELRTLQLRLVHFDEAMEHLQMVLAAREPDDRVQAERRAEQFLKRMQRFTEAHGAMRNEIQVLQSRDALGDFGKIVP